MVISSFYEINIDITGKRCDMKRCLFCGSLNDDNSRFCNKCGNNSFAETNKTENINKEEYEACNNYMPCVYGSPLGNRKKRRIR